MKYFLSFLLFFSFSYSAVLSNATVTLYKVKNDGTKEQVDIGTVTTNSNGEYEIDDIPITSLGNGDSSDFYYEVKITKGNDIVTAPFGSNDEQDKTVDVSKNSTFASKLLTETVEKTDDDTIIAPNIDIINASVKAVQNDISDISSKISLPNVSEDTKMSKMIQGITSLGNEVELFSLISHFGSTYKFLSLGSSVDFSPYLTRVTKRACRANEVLQTNPMPMKIAKKLGSMMGVSGTTYKISDLYTALEAETSYSETLANTVANYKSILSSIETKISTTTLGFTDIERAILLTKRALNSSTITSSSTLRIDQSVAFLYAMYEYSNGINSSKMCEMSTFDLTNVISNLTSDSSLKTAHISDYVIFNNSGFNCTDGHFRAEVYTYTPSSSITVDSVVISSSESTDLTAGSETLSLSGNKYESNTNGICVSLNKNITYTITAKFTNGSVISTVTETVNRKHLTIPEATNTYDNGTSVVNVSKDYNSPTNTSGIVRPLFSWEGPVATKASMTSEPAKSKIVFTQEFAHIDKTDSPIGPIASCEKDNSQRIYRTSSFIPRVDCDTSKCASDSSKTASNIQCRINIQTYLLDEYASPIGQAAGNFTFFQP